MNPIHSRAGRDLVTVCLTAAIGLAALSGCGGKADLGPPEIPLGQTECAACHMIISDAAFAAALVNVDNQGVVKLAFDDIGCLLDYRRKHSAADRSFEFFHDFDSRGWIPAAEASFVFSQNLQTPMASHLAACASSASARVLAERKNGKIVRRAELEVLTQSHNGDPAAVSRSMP